MKTDRKPAVAIHDYIREATFATMTGVVCPDWFVSEWLQALIDMGGK